MRRKNTRYVEYSDEIAMKICELRAEGESLRAICDMPGMPSLFAVLQWRKNRDDFAKLYESASEDGADSHAADIEDIAKRVLDGELDPAAARVAIDAKKWIACKLKNRSYGDKIENTHVGKNGGPVETVTRIEIVPGAPKADEPDSAN